jgi:hypothetical protein
LYYPTDRICSPSKLDSFVWDRIAACPNLKELNLDNYSHLNKDDLDVIAFEKVNRYMNTYLYLWR